MEDIEIVDADDGDEDPYLAASSINQDESDLDGADRDDADDDLDSRDDGDLVLEEGRRLLADAEAKLAAVERALARLDAGSYGLCEICSEPIAPNRLAERPSLARCEEHELETSSS